MPRAGSTVVAVVTMALGGFARLGQRTLPSAFAARFRAFGGLLQSLPPFEALDQEAGGVAGSARYGGTDERVPGQEVRTGQPAEQVQTTADGTEEHQQEHQLPAVEVVIAAIAHLNIMRYGRGPIAAGSCYSGSLWDSPPMRYGVVMPSYMRWVIRPWEACGRLWQWSIQRPGLSATKAIS